MRSIEDVAPTVVASRALIWCNYKASPPVPSAPPPPSPPPPSPPPPLSTLEQLEAVYASTVDNSRRAARWVDTNMKFFLRDPSSYLRRLPAYVWLYVASGLILLGALCCCWFCCCLCGDKPEPAGGGWARVATSEVHSEVRRPRGWATRGSHEDDELLDRHVQAPPPSRTTWNDYPERTVLVN